MIFEEIEERAEEALAEVPDWLWDGETLPVPIDDIADSVFSLFVRLEEDMTRAPGAPHLADGQSISGLLLASKGEIWVNAEEATQWPPRRRFTIGHELGHWCLHRQEGQQALFCRKTQIEMPEDGADKETRNIEREANIFAAALTMPGRLMRKHYERLRHEDDCHERMCRLFAASKAAMGKRMHTAI